MVSFLREMGLSATQIDELKNAPRDYDVLPMVSATMPREALATVDVTALAAAVTVPVLLLLGSRSPAWARDITGAQWSGPRFFGLTKRAATARATPDNPLTGAQIVSA